MKKNYCWKYNEFKHVGRDYSLSKEAEKYDEGHSKVRDINAENQKILDAIQLQLSDRLIEFGTGTGAFAIQAARVCRHVDAVDVSEAMLAVAKKKAADSSLSNISFHKAGFLTYEHSGELADVIMTSLSLHHLPDFWKMEALKRMNQMLKRNGKLFIFDIIFESENVHERIDSFIKHQADAAGDLHKEDVIAHFREEFSTYDWIMDELLIRTGYQIKSKQIEKGLFGIYLCLKQ